MNIFRINLIAPLFIIFFIAFNPVTISAQTPSVTFSGNPTAIPQNQGGSISVTISGQLNYSGGASASNTEVEIYISSEQFTGYPSNNFGQLTSSPGQGISGSNFSRVVSNSVSPFAGFFSPGQTYWARIDVFPPNINNPTDWRIIQFTIPGVGSPGPGGGPGDGPPIDGTNPNQDSGSINPSQDEEFITLGWPTAVITNTLSVDDINSFIVGLLNALLKIGIPVLAVFFIYAGLKLVLAQGNEKELEEAKKNLFWVIIGGAVLLGAWTVVRVLKGTFDQIELTLIYQFINYFV